MKEMFMFSLGVKWMEKIRNGFLGGTLDVLGMSWIEMVWRCRED